MPYHQEETFYNSDCEDEAYHDNFANAVVNCCKESNYLEHTISQSYIDSTDSYSSEIEDTQMKPVKFWSPGDIVHWLNMEARRLHICCTELASERFAQYHGSQLLSLSYDDFCDLDNRYGKILYDSIHHTASMSDSSDYEPLNSTSLTHLDENPLRSEIQNTLNSIYREDSSKKENEAVVPSAPTSPPTPPKKKGPGRPKGSKRKKKPEKMGRLWEFLRDLLKDRRYCPSHIAWDNYEEGMFRFVHSDKVAKLWGTKKDNPDMNYEKLSRAMRYYYKSKVLQPVYGRRLVYKFGPTAHGWRVDNPNFAE